MYNADLIAWVAAHLWSLHGMNVPFLFFFVQDLWNPHF